MSLTRSAKANGLFYADEGPADRIWLDRARLEAALAQSRIDGTAATLVIEHLARIPVDNVEIELDFGDRSWETIFQDIVRRSPSLRYVTAVSAFTCSRMRPDGFGGRAVLITAERVMGKSTSDIVADFLNAAESDRADELPHLVGSDLRCKSERKSGNGGTRTGKRERPAGSPASRCRRSPYAGNHPSSATGTAAPPSLRAYSPVGHRRTRSRSLELRIDGARQSRFLPRLRRRNRRVQPDAEQYPCESCGEPAVYGAAEILIAIA